MLTMLTDRMIKGAETGGEMHGDCGGRTHHCPGKVLRCPSNVDDDLLLIMLITFITKSRSVLTLRRVARSLAPATVLLANGVSGAPAKM